jgi:hypothetical protein
MRKPWTREDLCGDTICAGTQPKRSEEICAGTQQDRDLCGDTARSVREIGGRSVRGHSTTQKRPTQNKYLSVSPQARCVPASSLRGSASSLRGSGTLVRFLYPGLKPRAIACRHFVTFGTSCGAISLGYIPGIGLHFGHPHSRSDDMCFPGF